LTVLSRERVVAGALDLLDEVGLDGLTMRRLAAALGVQNGATYWHFPTKAALLAAMADALLRDVATGAPDGDWRTRVRGLAVGLHHALLARRDGARVYAGVFAPEPHALAYGEAVVGALRSAGLPDRDAVWAADALTAYVVAHTLEEQLAPCDAADRLHTALATGDYPNLAAAAPHIPAPHPPAHFDFGLDLLLTGLAERGGQLRGVHSVARRPRTASSR
jgi:TetR/AcrR family transcriptional regulator, tetracycline repressor protein